MKQIKTKLITQISIISLTILFSIFFVMQTNAAGVDLDNSFGNGGIVNKTFGPTLDSPIKSAIDANGKIVTVGSITDGQRDISNIIRFNPDGAVDETFGIRTERLFGEDVQYFTDVAIQPDGKIVVSGNLIFNNEDWQFLARYGADGNRDFAFGVPLAPRPVGGDYSFGSIELQDDGKIILAVTLSPLSGRRDLFLTRFNSNGTLDNSFGTSGNGTVITSTDVNNDEQVIDLKLQDDGKIIVYGYVFSGITGSRRLGVFRYNSDGTLDTTFGTNGVAIGDYGLFALLPRGETGIQSDGKIVFTSYAKTESDGEYKFLVVRYNADGTIDTSFDTDGVVTTQIQQRSFGSGLTIQSDGKLLVSGSSSDGTANSATVARYNSDGSLDTSFEGDGIATVLPENSSGATSIIQKSDGKLVGVGDSFSTSTGKRSFLLFGLNADGSSDNSLFGDGGVAIHPVGSRNNIARDILMQPDGKLVTVGSTSGGISNANMGIARFETNGSKDSGFGTDGEVVFDNGSGNNFIEAQTGAIQSDGKILAAGRISTNGNSRVAVLRLNSDGTPDTTFGTGGFGVVTPTIGPGTPNPNVVIIRVQSDGKIIFSGVFNSTGDPNNFDNDIYVARLNSDGILDNSFDSDGIATFANALGNDFMQAMKIQSNGKIAVLGNVNDGDNKTADRTMIRFNADGTTDNSFNIASAFGITESHYFTSFDCTISGKYVIGGRITSQSDPNIGEGLIVQMNSDGTSDSAFGNNGITRFPALPETQEISEVQIQNDGKILIAGQSFFGVFPLNKAKLFLARLNSGGSLDNTFNGNGVKDTGIVLNGSFYESMAVQSDGNIVLAGYNKPGGHTFSNTVAFIARFAITQPATTGFDYDGDARADVSVYRPSEGNWYFNSSTDGFSALQFGIATDTITPADYDGDGKTDLAVYRESQNRFYILQSSDGIVRQENFGIAGDDPTVVGDWDGDGKADIAVYRQGSQGFFYYLGSNNNPNNNITFLPWGTTGDKPVRGDFDGDGKLDVVVFRPSNGVWYILQSSNNQVRYEYFGLATDVLTPMDYDGDSKTDVAIYRDGVWYIKQSSDNAVKIITFGLANDVPVPADYDGDGKDDIAVYRDGVWYIMQSTNGNVSYVTFGFGSDTPTPIASQ